MKNIKKIGNMNKINIIDCTLRDGGYYNNWDFPNNLVNEYLKAVNAAGIKFVELGFRSLNKKVLRDPIGTPQIVI